MGFRRTICRAGWRATRPSGWIAPCALCLDTCADRAPCAVTGGRNAAMFTRLISRRFSALAVGFAVAAAPAYAADDIEAKAQTCAACHGQNGVPHRPKNHSDHLGSAAELSHEAIARLPKRRSRQPDHDAHRQRPCAGGSSQDRGLFRGQELAGATTRAAASAPPPNGIAQCQPCHQPNFEGGPPAPRLAGLSYEYLVASMRGFAADERTNNGDMPKFMQALTDSERDAMARYLAAR